MKTAHQRLVYLVVLLSVAANRNASAFVTPSSSRINRNTAYANGVKDRDVLFALSNTSNKNKNEERKHGMSDNSMKQLFHYANNNTKTMSFMVAIWMAVMSSFSLPLGLGPTAANAASTAAGTGPRVVGQLKGSGLVFKDTLQIESFDDPKVKGVTLYISTFQRPLTERLTSSFMTDPSDASVGCAKTGPVQIADNIAKGTGGEEVFEESKSLLFKTLRVQRIYDEEKNTVLYVSFNTRLDKGDDSNKSRFKSSICAVNLD